ncbi:MAG TPA: chitobiase/beta-hexosaminidase C-terminal domain-containing protein, partial [Candidatus Methylacidiphilales bacterium]|nr:chitobiase/beta-hexosaminidase C-terminal domain-containing protein [Candidatus Methylacidiphilales bacterium]
ETGGAALRLSTSNSTASSIVSSPLFGVPGGAYASSQTVALTSATSGASIYYTTDGSTPSSSNGTLYTGPISITTYKTILKSIATMSGLTNSAVNTAIYTITSVLDLPHFSLAGGSYTGPQTLTITSLSTLTDGASIRYTTDGTTPTSTNGTLYTGPITISATTTVYAVVYAPNFPNSAVVGATYALAAAPLTFQSTSLSYSATGASAAVQTDSNVPGGWVALEASSSGAYIECTLPSIPAGTYDLQMSYKTNSNRGILQMAVDGVDVGSPLDEYAALPSTYPTYDFGTVTFTASGSHVIRLTVTGKNSASSSYRLSTISFYLSTTTTTSPLTFQSTSLSYTATGASAAVQTDSNVPGGWVALEASSSGSYIEYTLPNIPTGTYDLQMSYKTNSNRGILQMTVDGVNVGSPLDEYATLPSTYPTHDFATVTFTAGGSHVIRLTVTGKNSASSSYQLSTISFYLYPSQ